MIIIERNKIQHQPMIDVINDYHFLNDLSAAIDEYMLANQQKTFVDGKPMQVFYVSGMAERHHERLVDYLNSRILREAPEKAILTKGHFAKFPTTHYWLQIDDLIVDITIKQFCDKSLDIYDSLKQLLDYQYLVSDNPQNSIYNMYTAA